MNTFFALISRMKFINRWALMRNTTTESLSVHSHETAVIAHALAVIGNKRLNKSYNPERAALLALYHDAGEIITGDMPTPIKYSNPELIAAYKSVEQVANRRLISKLPEDLQSEYDSIIMCADPADAALLPLVKAADKISALIKCIEEVKMGNSEFEKAKDTVYNSVKKLGLKEADIFLEEFIHSYGLSLDELN
ncbi:MAG: 5'-deoxynucleotidase [Clostridia bacterium]|nr:5'-deoxynucleotidase [Clostridia bacterium]